MNVNKRSKAISRLTGLAEKVDSFPVEISEAGIIVGGKNYGYSHDIESFKILLEEVISNARIDS